MRRTTRTAWGSDEGVALITVLGVITVITILAFGSYTLATQALGDSARVRDETEAYRAAASGLDTVLASFTEESLDDSYPIEGYTSDGTYTVTLEKLDYAGEYRLVSTGTGRDGSIEHVAQEFFYWNLWEMNFAGTGKQTLVSSGTINGSSNIVGPFYMKGDFAMNSSLTVQEGPIFVRGGFIKVNNAGVRYGTEDSPIVTYCDGDPNTPVGNKVYVAGDAAIDRVPDLITPTVTEDDLLGWAATARAESFDNNMGSVNRQLVPNKETLTASPSGYLGYGSPTYERVQASTIHPCYKYIGDPDNILDGSTGLTLDEDTGDFGWWGSTDTTGNVYPTSYPTGVYAANVHDDFAWDWDDGEKRGRLYIEGTVFVDGPLTIDCNVEYIGNGTIVANGPIIVRGYFRPEGETPDARANEWVVGLVTPETIRFEYGGGQMSGGNEDASTIRDRIPDVAGAFFGEERVFIAQNLLMQGSVISGVIEAENNNMWLVTNPMLPEYLPESLPGSSGGIIMPSKWRRY